MAKYLNQKQRDERDREVNIGYLANWWGESFACTKESLRFVSDRDVRIMADDIFGGEIR